MCQAQDWNQAKQREVCHPTILHCLLHFLHLVWQTSRCEQELIQLPDSIKVMLLELCYYLPWDEFEFSCCHSSICGTLTNPWSHIAQLNMPSPLTPFFPGMAHSQFIRFMVPSGFLVGTATNPCVADQTRGRGLLLLFFNHDKQTSFSKLGP